MKLADKHEAFENIGQFVRRVEHHLIFLWIDANKRDVHAMCADMKFVMIYLPEESCLKLHSYTENRPVRKAFFILLQSLTFTRADNAK